MIFLNGGILLVEDDESLSRAVSLTLANEGYKVYTAATAAGARAVFASAKPVLVICDIDLPDGNGLDLCAGIRRESDVMFLFLTALDGESDIINGYGAGADDYITKPFSMSVLVSKINAVMKRCVSAPTGIASGDIEYLTAENRAKKRGEYLRLTAREQRLLEYFMTNPTRILSKNQLLEALWDIDGSFVDDNTLAVNIRRLREKIEDDPSKPVYIKNVRGLGYIWERGCRSI